MTISSTKKAYLWLFLIGCIWLLAKTLSHHSPDWDNVEELVWANSFEIGYQKHPPLPTWLLYPATLIFGKSMTLSFFMGYFCIFISAIFTYHLFKEVAARANRTLPSYAPLVAVLGSSLIIYYTIRGSDFNHNNAQLWSISAMLLFYYKAWVADQENRAKDTYISWLLLGIFTGLALLTKYSVIIQIATLLFHFLWAKRWNSSRALLGLLVSCMTALLILTPHLIWLIEQASQHMGPLQYALHSTANNDAPLVNFHRILSEFVASQIYRVAPILISIFFVYRLAKKSPPTNHQTSWWMSLNKDDRHFLWIITLSPTLITVIAGGLFDINIEPKWAVTFYLTMGMFMWMPIKESIDIKLFIKNILIVHLIVAALYALFTGIIADAAGRTTRANYPGKELSDRMYQHWEQHPELTQGAPLTMIAGDVWTAGNAAIHSPNHGRAIQVWVDANDLETPWLKPGEKPLLMVIASRNKKSDYHGRHRGGEAVSPEVEALIAKASVKGHDSIPWTHKEDGPRLEVDWAIVKP